MTAKRKTVPIAVGNTYKPIPVHLANPSRAGQPKIHDWVLFVRPVNSIHAALISEVSAV